MAVFSARSRSRFSSDSASESRRPVIRSSETMIRSRWFISAANSASSSSAFSQSSSADGLIVGGSNANAGLRSRCPCSSTR